MVAGEPSFFPTWPWGLLCSQRLGWDVGSTVCLLFWEVLFRGRQEAICLSPSLVLPWKAGKSIKMDISERGKLKNRGHKGQEIWTRDLQALCSELAINFHLPLSFQSHAPEILGSKSPSGQF